MALIETHLFSEVLGMEMEVNVVLPQERRPYTGDGKLKVLWLLHGGSGDATLWCAMSRVERYAQEYGIAVIAPGGLNSCFTDMAHGGRFFTYLTEELPTCLRHLFPRLSAEREDSFIAGLSNGGFGASKRVWRGPTCTRPSARSRRGTNPTFLSRTTAPDAPATGLPYSATATLKNTDNDLKHLGREALKKGVPLPRVYHACGSLDPWLDLNVMMRDFFTGLEGDPYRYQYHEAEGYGHTWEFWDMELRRFLDFLGLPKDGSKYIGL
ncbi:esterase family protein [Paenibacillus sp. P25]|nr:esterase family protein [Paenibacillus sp. P25]